MAPTKHILARKILGTFLLLIALNGLGGGYYGMAGAKNVPLEWLAGSLFTNYFIPSVILFLFIGCLFLFAAILVFTQKTLAAPITQFCGCVLIMWIAIQVSIIGFVSWLQPAMLIAGVSILILGKLAFTHSKTHST